MTFVSPLSVIELPTVISFFAQSNKTLGYKKYLG